MNDIETLNGSVAGSTVTLTWTLDHLPADHGASIVSVELLRRQAGSETETVVFTDAAAPFDLTYADTVPAEGQYAYRLRVIAGPSPSVPTTTTLYSNVVSASTTASVTLSGSVSGPVVSLTWADGVGNVDNWLIERSANAGASYHTLKRIDGQLPLSYSEVLSSSGTFLYRVTAEVKVPQTPAQNKQDTTVVSNAVSLTVVGSGQD